MSKIFTYYEGKQNSFFPNSITVQGIEKGEYVFKVLIDFSYWHIYDKEIKELCCELRNDLPLYYVVAILIRNGYNYLNN